VRVACPDCTTPLEAAPGEEVVCPACMCRFDAPNEAQLPRRFDVYLPDGSVLHRQSSNAIREAIYTGKVPITARLRPDVGGDDLIPIYSLPWFSQIYALLGVEPPAHAGARRIAGWAGVRKVAPEPTPAPPPTPRKQVSHFFHNASVVALLGLGIVACFVLLFVVVLIITW
jgi:hypothetical protein